MGKGTIYVCVCLFIYLFICFLFIYWIMSFRPLGIDLLNW